jgi:hypothetical protein
MFRVSMFRVSMFHVPCIHVPRVHVPCKLKTALETSLKTALGGFYIFCVAGAYTQQGRAQSRCLHPDEAARPALMGRAAHAVESKAVVRIEVAVSPCPCLGCAVELALRVAPLRRGVPPR